MAVVRGYIETEYKIDKEYKSNNPNILGRFKALLSRANTVTKNRTYYSAKLWDNVLNSEEFKKKLKKKTLLGEIDHPDESDTSIKRVSHSVINVWRDGDEIWGECEVYNTPNGKILWTLLNAGVQLGISSRGLGSANEGVSIGGCDNVTVLDENDYELIAWDVVIDPSVVGAGVRSLGEGARKRLIKKLSVINESFSREIIESIENEVIKMRDNLELKVVRENLKKKIDELRKLKMENSKLENKVRELSVRDNKNSMYIEELKKELKDIKKRYKEEKSKLLDWINVMEDELKDKKVVIERMNNEISELREEAKKKYIVNINEGMINNRINRYNNDNFGVISGVIRKSLPKNM